MTAETLGHLVVLDDEANMGKILAKVLKLEGFDVATFHDPMVALPHILTEKPTVVLTDLRMPNLSGEEMLERIREKGLAETEVVMMTAYGTVESAMRCVKNGAFDYITKPFDTNELVATLKKAAAKARKANDQGDKQRLPPPPQSSKNSLIGDSTAMKQVRAMIEKIAPADTPVLISGESGTGKELAAREIHNRSLRADGPFVPINCASIPENLMESELFGHEKGAFTGAHEAKTGLVESAEGGTLFLDEIGELPLLLQSKILRTLQEREVSRVGGLERKKIDVRIVAATNRKLSAEVEAGNFREDLYYRLNVLPLKMPPLRNRRDDIALLSGTFLAEFREKIHKPKVEFAEGVLEQFATKDWPGNVRELRNVIERLVVFSENDLINEKTLMEASTGDSGIIYPDLSPAGSEPPDDLSIGDFREERDAFEERYLTRVLAACEGSVTEASKRAGISRRSFYEKLEKYGIDPSGFKS